MISKSEQVARRMIADGFNLGGSRRMAEKYPDQIKPKEGTDWDLYCEDSEEFREKLYLYGFYKLEPEHRNYWDNLLVDMFFHSDLKIEVLIRSDVKKYKEVFESISADEFIHRLWKSSPVRAAAFSAGVCDYFNTRFNQSANGDDLPW